MSRGFDRPRVNILLQSRGELIPLLDDYTRLIETVEINQVWDGADAIRLTMRAWDEHAVETRVIGERILEPGTSIVVRAGYGRTLRTMGRYTIVSHTPTFGRDRRPMVVVEAFDGFALLMDNTWPGDYGSDVLTWTDVALVMARKYGMGFAGDISGLVPKRVRKRRVRTRRKTPAGKRIYRSRLVRSKVIKNAGDTDAKMMKHLAGYAGFATPKVRFVESGSDTAAELRLSHPIVEGIEGRDVLLFRRIDVQRQIREAAALRFSYLPDGERDSTLETFQPVWNTKDTPVAVRVTGVVPGPPRAVITAEAEVVDAALLRERDSLLRRAALEADLAKRAELSERAQDLAGRVVVTRGTRTNVKSLRKKRDRRRFRNMGESIQQVDVLESERRPGLEWDARKKRRVQTMKREVMRSAVIVSTGADVDRIARAWLETRLQLHITGSASVRDIPGLEALYPNQVHEFDDLSPEYNGFYIIKESTHLWARDGHSVQLKLQRVAEAPTPTQTSADTMDIPIP